MTYDRVTTAPIPLPGPSGRPSQFWRTLALVLAVAVVVLAIATVVGFGRAAQVSAAARGANQRIAALERQVQSQATQLAEAKHCIAEFQKQRDDQSEVLADAGQAIDDLRQAVAAAGGFDFGRAASLVTQATGKIGAASAAFARANAESPSDC
ncbi:hypothetical protein [uncultured Amnibacterium sp.]|uniref:hypothetical protein n=1 Tax=uncultured Amnibacterium sp. TaxID=1631851 RepID=UPI0035C9C593